MRKKLKDDTNSDCDLELFDLFVKKLEDRSGHLPAQS